MLRFRLDHRRIDRCRRRVAGQLTGRAPRGRRFACRDPYWRGGKGLSESPPGWFRTRRAMHLSPPGTRFIPAGGGPGAVGMARYAPEQAAKRHGIRRDTACRNRPRRRPASVSDQRVKAAGHNVPNLQHRLENHAKRRGKGTFLVARPRGLAMVHPRIAVLAFRVGLADDPGVGKTSAKFNNSRGDWDRLRKARLDRTLRGRELSKDQPAPGTKLWRSGNEY
jgi:hypothetical protein